MWCNNRLPAKEEILCEDAPCATNVTVLLSHSTPTITPNPKHQTGTKSHLYASHVHQWSFSRPFPLPRRPNDEHFCLGCSRLLGTRAFRNHSEANISHVRTSRVWPGCKPWNGHSWPFLWVSCLGTGGTGPCFAFDVFTLFPEQDQSLMWLACRCTSRLPPEKFIPYSSLTQDEG